MMQIEGLDSAIRKLGMTQFRACQLTEYATKLSMDKLQQMAMKDLSSKLGTGEWGGTWSHGDKQIHIEDAWESEGYWNGGVYMGKLSNKSPHAAVVEFGYPGIIRPESAYDLYLGDGVHKQWVKGQAGYHYLEAAMNQDDRIKMIYTETWRKLVTYNVILT